MQLFPNAYEVPHQRHAAFSAKKSDGMDKSGKRQNSLGFADGTCVERLHDPTCYHARERHRLSECHHDLRCDEITAVPRGTQVRIHKASNCYQKEANSQRQSGVESPEEQRGNQRKGQLRKSYPKERRTNLLRTQSANPSEILRNKDDGRQKHKAEYEQNSGHQQRVSLPQKRQID